MSISPNTRKLRPWAFAAIGAAEICRVTIGKGAEPLESRIALSGNGLVVGVPGEVVTGETVSAHISWQNVGGQGSFSGGAFIDSFGAREMGSLIRIDTPTAGFIDGDGNVQIVGAHNNQGASDFIGGNVVMFDSFLSENGGNGSTEGIIRDAIHVPGMGSLYVGSAAGSLDVSQPTYWRVSSNAEGGVGPDGRDSGGQLLSVSILGDFTGGASSAVWGTPDELLEFLPPPAASVAVDVSADGLWTVGTQGRIWTITNGSAANFSTNGFDLTVTGGNLPDWRRVETDAAGTAYFLGEYFDLNTFGIAVGVWRQDGAYLGSFGIQGVDAAQMEGEVVFAVNGDTEGYLIRASDMAVVSVEELTGVKAFVEDIFTDADSLGLVLDGEVGYYTEVYQTFGGSNPEPDVVNIKIDFDGDGTFDLFYPDIDGSVVAEFHYGAPGMYSMLVVATDQGGAELGSVTRMIEVSPWAVRDVEGQQVLFVGADEDGSHIRVTQGRRGGINLQIDRERLRGIEADRVEIYGSDARDDVDVIGVSDVYVSLRGGNDTLFAVGYDIGFFDLGAGDDFSLTRGYASIIVAGYGQDNIIGLDDKVLYLSGHLDYGTAERDLLMAEMFSEDTDWDFIGALVEPLVVDDEVRDTAFLLAGDWLFFDDPGDRTRTWGRRR